MSVPQANIEPRDVFSYVKPQALDAEFIRAYERGRLHHAWLLCGPQGMGKATYAWRLARFLLSRSKTQASASLDVGADAVASRLLSASSHPDFMVLQRDTGKKSIAVEKVREISNFFSKSPSLSDYRVCLIDAVDDLNANSANALLKILEEPPQRGVLLLISHSPGRLLPTIRSRCRRLQFTLWSDAEVADFVAARADITPLDNERLRRMAKGAPGRALHLWAQGGLAIDDMVFRLFKAQTLSETEIIKWAQSFKSSTAKYDSAANFSLTVEYIMDYISDMALKAEDLESAQNLAKLWSRIAEVVAEADTLNLDRADFFWSIIQDIQQQLLVE
jgi:DNA polymerase III subunit delta'